MSVAIVIVSHQPDSWWLRIALQSIRKYAMGFERVVVACPSDGAQQAVLRPICEAGGAECVPIHETPGKGHLSQNVAKCRADTLTDADYVMHLDSDSVFTEPAMPSDYFVNGRPILWRRSYASLFRSTHGAWQAAFRKWQDNVQRALGWSEEWETMQRLPIVHERAVYAATRKRVEQTHGVPFDQWVMAQDCVITPSGERVTQPGFTEFDTLGSVALHEFAHRYEVMTVPDDVTGLPTRWPGGEAWSLEPRPKVRQFMSNELRSPGGISEATLAELRSCGLEP